MEGLEGISCEEWLKTLGLSSLEKRLAEFKTLGPKYTRRGSEQHVQLSGRCAFGSPSH